MPQWIHERAEHLLAKNPDMKKSTAFAVATQQSHALGKSPKGYGTAEGKRTAKAKFDTPKDDKKMANPGNLETPKLKAAMLNAFVDELEKIGTDKLALGEQLLARAAASRGINPSQLGAIKQFTVKKTMQGVPAAHEQAHRIVDFLKTQPKVPSVN